MEDEGLQQLMSWKKLPDEHRPTVEKENRVNVGWSKIKARVLQRLIERQRVQRPEVKPSDEVWVHLATTSVN